MSYPTGRVPILALRNTVLYPGVQQALRVGRDKSVKALQNAFENGNWILTVAQKSSHPEAAGIGKEDHTKDELYQVGTLAKIESVRGSADKGFQIIVRGYKRMKINEIYEDKKFLEGLAEDYADVVDLDASTQKALHGSLQQLAKEVLELIPGNMDQLAEMVQGVEDLAFLTHLCAAHADFGMAEKQNILESVNLRERAMTLLNLLHSFRENLKVQADIRNKLSQQFGESQRQVILKEQLKAIKDELGEDEAGDYEFFKKKIEAAGMTEEARKLADSQLKRLKETNPASPEFQVIRSHLELMVSLPWSKSSDETEIDLDQSEKILNDDHYGLAKIKKRILQHLSVMKLTKNRTGSILLFVGPPGVGKTSLGQSIARALGRKYIRVSLGGVRDDSEIRGHRRTYIGSMAGRIINGIKRVGENNPVFVLDEIDKMSRSFSGDPASAMLEVLDPEQNNAFLDHYLDTGFDLSKVFFIATANSLDGIPGPLLDRMEVVDVTGYTLSEKFHIARNHLVPKLFEEFGLDRTQAVLSDEVLLKVISSYTREAGVRELKRKIAEILRAVTEKVVRHPDEIHRIELKDVEEHLGHPKHQPEITEVSLVPGVSTGMAWTPVGGDILFVESVFMAGKGSLMITGQLGEVMKESAQIALTLLRSRLPMFAPKMDFANNDVHVHVPAGAIPKDGPSAGVTLLASMASLFVGRPVDAKMAMTGEITLRGAVMPVGGIKEKVIAAHRAGVLEVILPAKNRKDLDEIPDEVKKDLQFHFVDNVNQVLRLALGLKVDEVDLLRLGKTQLIPPPVSSGDSN